MFPGLLDVGGYVLAGGKSSRMGRDKALLTLRGKPLVAHAAEKLGRICHGVRILSGNQELAPFAPLVSDIHPGCGPMGGLESALSDSAFDWNLILPVDVPFVPTALLRFWASATLGHGRRLGTRLSLFTVEGRPQPALLLAHRDLLPFVSEAIGKGWLKLLPVLEGAAEQLLAQGPETEDFRLGRTTWPAESEFVTGPREPPGRAWEVLTEAQRLAQPLWFSNVNTPEEFAEAERRVDALDT